MLDAVAGDARPAMAPLLIDGSGRRREIGIGEGAYGHRDQLRLVVGGVEDGRAAARAEMVETGVALVADPAPFVGLAADGDLFGPEARLHGKGAACPLLAGEAVAGGDAHRLALASGVERAAAAAGSSGRHDAEHRPARRPLP